MLAFGDQVFPTFFILRSSSFFFILLHSCSFAVGLVHQLRGTADHIHRCVLVQVSVFVDVECAVDDDDVCMDIVCVER